MIKAEDIWSPGSLPIDHDYHPIRHPFASSRECLVPKHMENTVRTSITISSFDAIKRIPISNLSE